MYFLTSMCFICLKSKSDLNAITAETLTKLLYFVEKGEDFIPHFNQTKMCNDCLDKLDVASHFKQMCLNNIVQFEEYVAQLQQTCNKFSLYDITVDLIDVNKSKEDLEVHESTVLKNEHYSNNQPETVLIKEEVLDEIYFESFENNETQMKYLNKDLLLRNQESIEEELQSQSAEASNVDLNDKKHFKITDESEIHLIEQPEKVFIKNEILNEINLQPCESSEPQKQYCDEESKLLLHKEEILDDVYDGGEDNHFRKILEHDHSQSQLLSKNANNKGCHKNDLFFICGVCGKGFTLKTKLIRHVRIHTKHRPYECDKCKKGYIKKKYFNKHMLIHSNNWPHYCSECKKGFLCKNSLNNHILSHANERPYCSVCKKNFFDKWSLSKHMVVHSGEKPYSCLICKKTFTQKSSLTQHKNIHTEKLPYSCLECKKRFRRKDILRRHVVTHSRERPHSCSICLKSFAQKAALKVHMRSHYNERPFSCSICKKSFNHKCNLDKHMVVHSGEKPYSCLTCNKNFTQKSSLNLHKVIHTEDLPYSCSECKRRFRRKDILQRHIITHSSERPYSCSICKKNFKLKSVLKLHELTHTNERPHSCSVCLKGFTQKARLNKHMLIHSNK